MKKNVGKIQEHSARWAAWDLQFLAPLDETDPRGALLRSLRSWIEAARLYRRLLWSNYRLDVLRDGPQRRQEAARMVPSAPIRLYLFFSHLSQVTKILLDISAARGDGPDLAARAIYRMVDRSALALFRDLYFLYRNDSAASDEEALLSAAGWTATRFKQSKVNRRLPVQLQREATNADSSPRAALLSGLPGSVAAVWGRLAAKHSLDMMKHVPGAALYDMEHGLETVAEDFAEQERKAERARPQQGDMDAADLTRRCPSAEAEFEAREGARQMCAQARGVLTKTQFEIFERLADGQDVAAISEAMGKEPANVRQQMSLMRKRLAAAPLFRGKVA